MWMPVRWLLPASSVGRKSVIAKLEEVKLTLVQWPEQPSIGDDVFLKVSGLPCGVWELLKNRMRYAAS